MSVAVPSAAPAANAEIVVRPPVPLGRPSAFASSGATASCCYSSPGATSRCATSRRSSASPGPSSSRSRTMVVFTLFFGASAACHSEGGRTRCSARRRSVPWHCSSTPSRSRRKQPRRQREPDHEGLLSAARCSRRAGARRPGRLRDRDRRAGRGHGRSTASARTVAARWRCRCSCCSRCVTALGVGLVALGPQRPVPRRPLRGAVPRPVLAVREPVAYPASCVAGELRHVYDLNPMAGRRRGLPLGAPRQRRPRRRG